MTSEATLLDTNLHIMGSPFLKDLLHGFKWAHKCFSFKKDGEILPSYLTMEQLCLLLQSKLHITTAQERSVMSIMNQYGIKTLVDLWDGNCNWHIVALFCSFD